MSRSLKSSGSTEHGFSLIEVIVVVAIIALMASLLVGSLMQDLDRLAKLEAQRFMAVVNEVRDEAIISGQPFILYFDDTSYGFDRGISAETNIQNSLLRTRRLHEALKAEVSVVRTVAINESSQSSRDEVMIGNLGEIDQFEFSIDGEKHSHTVIVNNEGGLEYQTRAFVGG